MRDNHTRTLGMISESSWHIHRKSHRRQVTRRRFGGRSVCPGALGGTQACHKNKRSLPVWSSEGPPAGAREVPTLAVVPVGQVFHGKWNLDGDGRCCGDVHPRKSHELLVVPNDCSPLLLKVHLWKWKKDRRTHQLSDNASSAKRF